MPPKLIMLSKGTLPGANYQEIDTAVGYKSSYLA